MVPGWNSELGRRLRSAEQSWRLHACHQTAGLDPWNHKHIVKPGPAITRQPKQKHTNVECWIFSTVCEPHSQKQKWIQLWSTSFVRKTFIQIELAYVSDHLVVFIQYDYLVVMAYECFSKLNQSKVGFNFSQPNKKVHKIHADTTIMRIYITVMYCYTHLPTLCHAVVVSFVRIWFFEQYLHKWHLEMKLSYNEPASTYDLVEVMLLSLWIVFFLKSISYAQNVPMWNTCFRLWR